MLIFIDVDRNLIFPTYTLRSFNSGVDISDIVRTSDFELLQAWIVLTQNKRNFSYLFIFANLRNNHEKTQGYNKCHRNNFFSTSYFIFHRRCVNGNLVKRKYFSCRLLSTSLLLVKPCTQGRKETETKEKGFIETLWDASQISWIVKVTQSTRYTDELFIKIRWDRLF